MSDAATIDGQGYFTDLEYEVFQVYQPMNPSYIHFFSAFRGFRAPNFLDQFSYCELGCGQGYSLLMMGALYPTGRFVGVDFSAPQIARARKLAEACGSDNVEFAAASFADFAAAEGPQFDVIALHGVWTWVAPKVQQEILDILARRLKPGGYVYVSANVQPGWAPVAPYQRLILEMRQRAPEASAADIFAQFKAFYDSAPRFFGHSPRAKLIFDNAFAQGVSYFAHEYMNECWEPVVFHELAADLEGAGLEFVSSGRLRDALDPFFLTPQWRDLLGGVEDATWRETMKDMLRDETFRQDYFARAPGFVTSRDQYVALASCRIGLVDAEAAKKTAIRGPHAETPLDPELRAAYLERLEIGPALVHELLDLEASAAKGLGLSLQTVFALMAIGACEIGLGEGMDQIVRQRASVFNAAVLTSAERLPNDVQLAAPTLRAPVMVTLKDRTYLRAYLEGRDPVAEILKVVDKTGARVEKDGKLLTSKAERWKAARVDFEKFRAGRLPFFAQMGIVGFAEGDGRRGRAPDAEVA
jgi:SAM-dependent methyltransferase